jgi:hypothetical protein
MLRIAMLLLLPLLFSSTAGAQELTDFDESVILRSVQCEFGRAASRVYETAPQPMLVGKVTWSREEFTGKSAEGGFSIWSLFSTNANASNENSTRHGAIEHRNLSSKNLIACADRNKVDLKIDECLIKEAEKLKVEGQQVTCGATTTGTLTLKAGAGGNIWLVNVSTTASFSKKWVYTVDVLMPKEGSATPQPVSPPAVASVSATPVQTTLHKNTEFNSAAHRSSLLAANTQ